LGAPHIGGIQREPGLNSDTQNKGRKAD
jgi:hypothetical protein